MSRVYKLVTTERSSYFPSTCYHTDKQRLDEADASLSATCNQVAPSLVVNLRVLLPNLDASLLQELSLPRWTEPPLSYHIDLPLTWPTAS